MSQKTFVNDLVAIPKSKATLKPSKPAYVGRIRKLDLIRVLLYKFYYDYIKNMWY